MSESENLASSQVAIIRESILGFINNMNQEKRATETQIREKTEAIKSQFFSQGSTQFAFAQVNDLTNSYRDEFLGLYRNSIHLKLLANGSSYMRQAIEYGLVNSGIVQEEWLEAFNGMQDQINQYESMANQLETTEQSLLEHQERVSELQVGATITQSDMSQFEKMMAEKDRVIAEKDQEILNLSEGLSRMENQVNSMGQNMLQTSMEIEELQSVIGDKDLEVSGLREQLSSSSTASVELENLREQVKVDKLRISELENQITSASGDLVDQLQENLKSARDELLKTRKDLVNKNEDIYQIKLQQDEVDAKAKRQDEQFTQLKEENKQLRTSKQNDDTQLKTFQEKSEKFEKDYSNAKEELESTQSKYTTSNTELVEVKEKLANFEGMATITPQKQAEYDTTISELQSIVKKSDSTIQYFKTVLAQDVKFKALIFLDSVTEEIRLDNLSKGIGLHQDTVHRAVIELSESGFAKTRKEGRFFYVSKGGHESPISLQAILA